MSSGISPQVEVHRTSDDAVTGTLRSAPGWSIEGMSAAAGDRTFFVTETAVGKKGSIGREPRISAGIWHPS